RPSIATPTAAATSATSRSSSRARSATTGSPSTPASRFGAIDRKTASCTSSPACTAAGGRRLLQGHPPSRPQVHEAKLGRRREPERALRSALVHVRLLPVPLGTLLPVALVVGHDPVFAAAVEHVDLPAPHLAVERDDERHLAVDLVGGLDRAEGVARQEASEDRPRLSAALHALRTLQ